MWCTISIQLLCWLFLGYLQPAEMVNINSNSSSNFIPLGTYVTFTCTGFMSDETFLHTFNIKIGSNDTGILAISDDAISHLANRNISTERNSSTLTIFAATTNNMTVVQCQDGGVDPPELSDPINVTVIGPPLAPYIEFAIVSFTELRLDWEEPFTWPDHNITQYKINQIVGPGVSNTTLTNQTTYSYLSPNGSILESCKTVMFEVSAYSDLGFGESFISNSYGLPIELDEIGEVKTAVRFTQAGDPEVNITVQVPPACAYQTVTLTLKLTDENGKTLPVMSRSYNGSVPPQSFLFHMPLKPNINYSLEVMASTVTQNVTKFTQFDTQQPFTTYAAPLSELLVPVIGGVAGGLVVILVPLIIFICFCAYAQHKTRNQRRLQRRSAHDGSFRDSAYEYIEEYQMAPISQKNQYTEPRPLPRPDSPYQDMKAVETGTSHHGVVIRNMASPRAAHYTAVGPQAKPTPSNGTMHVTPGGSVVFQSRASEDSIAEGEYTTMNSAGTPAHQQMQISVTVPDNTLPYSGQPNGEYKFTVC